VGPDQPRAPPVSTDSAGNHYTELTHFTASDGTELSVWSAPITQGGGTPPGRHPRPSPRRPTSA